MTGRGEVGSRRPFRPRPRPTRGRGEPDPSRDSLRGTTTESIPGVSWSQRAVTSGRSHEFEERSLRLYCFPYAGGTVASYFPWSKQLRPEIDIRSVEYPGRGIRRNDSPSDSLSALVETLWDTIGPELEEPFALLGHSFGALVAFELARLTVRRRAPRPARLLVSAARAPHLAPRELVHQLPDATFLDRLIRFDGVPQEALENQELLDLVLPIVRHDFRIFEEYRYQDDESPLPVPISVFGGLQDPEVPVPDLLAWSVHTTKSFRSRFYPGRHFFAFDQKIQLLGDIVEDLKAAMQEVLPRV